MNFQTPMSLFLGNTLIGQIVTYFYETPWASGKFDPADQDQLTRFIEVCELLDEIETWPDFSSKDEEEKQWQTALLRRGISDDDNDQYSKGPWIIQTRDEVKYQLIMQPVFDKKGFLTWRW